MTEIATALSASGPVESFEAQLGLKMTIWLSEYNDYWAGVATVKAVTDAGFLEGAIKNLQKSTVAGWRKEMKGGTLTAAEQEERIALYSKIFGICWQEQLILTVLFCLCWFRFVYSIEKLKRRSGC